MCARIGARGRGRISIDFWNAVEQGDVARLPAKDQIADPTKREQVRVAFSRALWGNGPAPETRRAWWMRAISDAQQARP
jgi:hypothetical protein